MAALSVVDFRCATASRALDAQHGMGDGALVLKYADGVLLAVVDGVGHGAEAAVARRCAEVIIERTAGPDLRGIVMSCHEGLRATRGATLGLAWLDAATGTMGWLGIGGVVGVLHRARSSGLPLLMPQSVGVVGRRLPALLPATVTVGAGDTILLATDGVGRRFICEVPGLFKTEGQIADRLIEAHASGTDDALVLVARGPGSAA